MPSATEGKSKRDDRDVEGNDENDTRKAANKRARALVQHTTRRQRRQATSGGLVKLHMKDLQQGVRLLRPSQTLIFSRKVSANLPAKWMSLIKLLSKRLSHSAPAIRSH
jgi:hypothetical protein